jgi:excisionase family DNA binding protein
MNMSQPVTVAEAAVMLNVSPAYVVRLIGNGKLRASGDSDGKRTVSCEEAEAYRLRAKQRGRNALEELARVSQEAAIYGTQK